MSKTKIALVTGANRGIGFETCRQLAEKGFTVILTSRNREKGKQAAEKLRREYSDIEYHQLDVTDDETVMHVADYVKESHGRLDVLVNNAGINYDSNEHAITADLDIVRDTLETNLLGPWRVSKAFIPLIKKSESGRIVNVSSGSGALNNMTGGTPAYGVSKTALNALTVKLADELKGSGILVNAVCPGWVRTDMGGSAAPRSKEEGASGIVWAATLPGDGPTGGFFRDGKRIEW
ncbi:SDR family oxidoreductase [Rhodohalobacter sp. 8-1]|uniref:SDR family oxidoreductase n=1 Tax=Rhodohalobacter sp. 8-1 TaxID=3131972 RepID=UPI0030EC6C45